MDLLALSDEPDKERPICDTLTKRQKVLGLGEFATILALNPLTIPGPLRFVVDPYVLGRSAATRGPVLFQKPVDILHEDTALQCVLQHCNQRAVSRQENGSAPVHTSRQ